MPGAVYRPPDGFSTMAQAAEQIGVSLVTLRKLVQRTGVELFQDPRDARAKLMKSEDVERLKRPAPMKVQPSKRAA